MKNTRESRISPTLRTWKNWHFVHVGYLTLCIKIRAYLSSLKLRNSENFILWKWTYVAGMSKFMSVTDSLWRSLLFFRISFNANILSAAHVLFCSRSLTSGRVYSGGRRHYSALIIF